MSLNARLMGRVLSVHKILVEGIAQTPEGAVADGKVTQYMLIRGSTGNDAIVDGSGNLVCMLKGSENLPIAQDASGNMVAVMKGSEDLIIAQDTSGNMIAAMKGLEGANVRDIAVDVNGNMVTLMKGDDGTNLQTIKVDASGQMYVAMTGQSLSVDNQPSDYFKASEYPADYAKSTDIPSDYFKSDESAVMKGDDAGTKRLVAVDTSGIMLSRMKGAYGAVLKDILLDDTGIMLSRMKGSFGGALKDIGVDTDGNMISVMKGNYGGVLKTWKVDTDGRGEMFISDPTDVWGNIVPMGLAEHTVRTHAPPMVFDRRGDVMHWEDFESPTRHVIITPVNAATANRSTDISKTGDFTLKTTVTAANDGVKIGSGTSDFHLDRVGQQIVFSADADDYIVKNFILYHDGTNGRYWQANYEAATGHVVMYSDLTPTTLGTVKRYNTFDMFASQKLVVDLEALEGVRLLCFGVEYDISGYTPHTWASATERSLTHYIEIWGSAAATVNIYTNDIILTGNEPL